MNVFSRSVFGMLIGADYMIHYRIDVADAFFKVIIKIDQSIDQMSLILLLLLVPTMAFLIKSVMPVRKLHLLRG